MESERMGASTVGIYRRKVPTSRPGPRLRRPYAQSGLGPNNVNPDNRSSQVCIPRV
jgi:hypothetical protein